jgi:hypothetical protein
MLATIFKLSYFELKPLAERIEDLARVTAFEESVGEHV